MSYSLLQPSRKLILLACQKQYSGVFYNLNKTLCNHFSHKDSVCVKLQIRSFSDDRKDVTLRERTERHEVQTDVKTTVKEATKTVSYSAVILVGIGVTAALFYAVFRELFSSKSPSGVYSTAFKRCCADTRIQDSLGEPIKGHGEETSRGRRRHVSHVKYEKDGVPHIRMVFYLKGTRNNGTVHLEMYETSSGDFDYRYLFVQLDDYSRRVIVLEDKRAMENAIKSFKTPLDDIPDLGILDTKT